MTHIPTLETARLLLRPWRDSDISSLDAILADPEVTRYLFGTSPASAHPDGRDAYQRRLMKWERDGMGFWALEAKDGGELVGWTGLQRVEFEEGVVGEVEVGWTLGREWWGRELAREAGEASLGWGFDTVALERIYAFCHPENARSERVMVKLGMEPAGTSRDLRDGMLSKLYVMTAEGWRGRRRRAFG